MVRITFLNCTAELDLNQEIRKWCTIQVDEAGVVFSDMDRVSAEHVVKELMRVGEDFEYENK